MKTTVEIADSLFEEAKACARARRVPLRELIEEGLRTVVRNKTSRKPFKLRDGSVGGQGLQGDLSGDDITELIYEGRGGLPNNDRR
ncbi:MAG TPA: hypothetical protein VN841_07850 [Bryobacteraceae bacterium]|nr:hypothetical protein [Bryobacteraceae bacterium]